jgi:methionyl-tRNA formyltransferase
VKIAIIGRSETLFETALLLRKNGHKIVCILTSKEAVEYTKTAADFKNLAQDWKVNFAQGPKILGHKKMLKDSNADIAISINYTGIIPQEVVDLFPLGILNGHAGDLPRYRGNACQAWAILNGEEQIGLCIHKMVGGELDSGDIITRDYFSIDHTTKITKVMQWIKKRTPELMLEAAELLKKSPNYYLEKQSADRTLALRCYPRKPEDGKIDWNKSAIEILRLINASNRPYAGAFCFYESHKITIWDAVICDTENFLAIPGQITFFDERCIEVATGSGKLRLTEIQVGSNIIQPSEIIKSIRDRLT